MNKLTRIAIIFSVAASLVCCTSDGSQSESTRTGVPFSSEELKVPDKGVRKIKGQVVYVPTHLSIPYRENRMHHLSTILAIHNTDLKVDIRITHVYLFDIKGRLVKNLMPSPRQVRPLESVIFHVLKEDANGAGANFLLEWMSDRQVNEPLTEAVMYDLSGGLGRLAFTSNGRVVREMK